jgi:capsular exopolysaccharide synthesis family protein
LIIALAGFVGFVLGSGAAYVLEFLDRTVKTTADVEKIFNLPVIGYVTDITDDNNLATHVGRNPNSVIAENFRLLRSNIEFFQISNPIKTLLITSPSQGNGKTTIATNLALSISQGEQDIVLVDADLRRPNVHTGLKMAKEPGLSDVIRNKAEIQGVVRQPKSHNINVITAGTIPPNVTEVVGSKRISSILARLKDSFELVIVDAPPLIISDSFNLASKVDAMILVMVPGETTIDQAKAIKEQLDRAEARVLGVVFNKLSEQMAHGYGDYQYKALYSPRYYGDYIAAGARTSTVAKPESRSKKIMAFFEHGDMPADVAAGVESAITAIKTQPRNLVNKIRKTRSKKSSSQAGDNGHSE